MIRQVQTSEKKAPLGSYTRWLPPAARPEPFFFSLFRLLQPPFHSFTMAPVGKILSLWAATMASLVIAAPDPMITPMAKVRFVKRQSGSTIGWVSAGVIGDSTRCTRSSSSVQNICFFDLTLWCRQPRYNIGSMECHDLWILHPILRLCRLHTLHWLPVRIHDGLHNLFILVRKPTPMNDMDHGIRLTLGPSESNGYTCSYNLYVPSMGSPNKYTRYWCDTIDNTGAVVYYASPTYTG
jgi:hypothetical protein